MSTQAASPGPGRVNQKARTRAAILQAARELTRTGGEISMPAVARAALVSEATAYRYFPDLASLLMEADTDAWPDPAQALAPVAGSADPVERIGYAAEFLLTGILARQSVVRAMIAAAITRPELAASRPGHRFALIDYALAPLATARPDGAGPAQAGTVRGHECRGPVRPDRPVRAVPAGRGGQRRPHRALPHRGRAGGMLVPVVTFRLRAAADAFRFRSAGSGRG